MSRAFNPPSTLSKDEIRTIADVRRDIWTSGFRGMGYGSFGCLAAHYLVKLGHDRHLYKLPGNPLGRNTAMAAFMIGGTFGAFVASTTTGKNEVHNLHPIYDVGSRKPTQRKEPGDAYRKNLERAWERESELKALVRRRTSESMLEDHDDDHDHARDDVFVDEVEDAAGRERIERRRNRLLRRASLQEAMSKRKGLSDSHGGRWTTQSPPEESAAASSNPPTSSSSSSSSSSSFAEEDAELVERKRNRLMRRASLTRTLASQKGGLSDSHGGQWNGNSAYGSGSGGGSGSGYGQ